MTIKRRLFFSNIRIVLVTIGGFIIAFLAVRLIFYIMGGTWWNEIERNSGFERYHTRGWTSLFLLVSAAIFILFISIINNILTYRMIKNITKPLEILTRGVYQIHEKNFAHRIEYTGDDEFRPVCEAFN